MAANPLYCLRFSPEDRALLDKLAERERLKSTDILRRALHFYAEHFEALKVLKTPRKAKAK